MASKLKEYRRMSEEAQRQLTGSLERWQSFLATASRLYKYPYHEQYVLANTVQYKDWDGRISRANREWAQTVPVVPNPDLWGGDRNCYFVVDQARIGLVDLFVTHF